MDGLRDRITFAQLIKRFKNYKMEANVDNSAYGKAKCFEAKTTKLLEDFLRKKTLDHIYICSKTITNLLFFQVNFLDF